MSDALLDELLAKPVGPALPRRATPEGITRELEVSGATATATIVEPEEVDVDNSTAYDFLMSEGLSPVEWEVTGFRKSRWGTDDAPMQSVRFTFKRVAVSPVEEAYDLASVLEEIGPHDPVSVRPVGTWGYVVLIGDMQFGKIDGDGPAGTVARTIACLNQAADTLSMYVEAGFYIGHVHVIWLGDHVEGFVSQGGANSWRTQLTLSEQIRLTRRVMLHALTLFAPLANEVSMAAVPGNHGQTVRFEGNGITRYDDSHDTESLIAVADAAALVPAYQHVKFYVPDTDEKIVVTDVAGTRWAAVHGDDWRPGKHFDWWSGQAFNRESPMHDAHVLTFGHWHHELVDTDTDRLAIGVPAMESVSTWFKTRTGTGGAPGLLVALTRNGLTPIKHTITQEGIS